MVDQIRGAIATTPSETTSVKTGDDGGSAGGDLDVTTPPGGGGDTTLDIDPSAQWVAFPFPVAPLPYPTATLILEFKVNKMFT